MHSVRERVASWRKEGLRVGFVPTMGNLHKGHLSLVAEAQEYAQRVVVSIFVNPLQFGPNEDFDKYPRTLEHDTDFLGKVNANLLFAPTTFEMYPTGFERSTCVDVPELSTILEGHVRPGHFVGVATVVTKLMQIVQPDVAVFGEKDYQQLMIIRRLVGDLCMPVEIIGAPTVRDHDGLAFSSRNKYLSKHDRNAVAPRLYETLKAARRRINDGDRDFTAIQEFGMTELTRAGFVPDYFTLRQAKDLLPLRADSRELVILAAARVGSTRLIDNLRVTL